MTRPASYAKRVEQAMLDLLGVFRGRRIDITPGPKDPLPVGIRARLGLLALTDPAVLTAGMRSTVAETVAARRASVTAAAGAAVPELTQHIGLPVRCGKRLHFVMLRPNDELWLPRHRDLDPAVERVAAALGGELLPCVRELDGALRTWRPPVADDGPRTTPISVGELLAFVLTCRSWLRRGLSLADCATAVEQGIGHASVVRHLELGLPLTDAVEWSAVPADEAVRWREIGFSSSDVYSWRKQGRDLADAEAALPIAGEGKWLSRWSRVTGSSVGIHALAEWAANGLPVGVWGEVASRGVSAHEARAWLAEGFTSVEVLRYSHLRVEIAEALRWRTEGFTAFVAAGCLGVGMTLEDACALRGLPSREVQDAWRTVHSVEAVRAMVSP